MEEGYAQALWKVIHAGTPAHKAVQALTETLKAHGRIALSPRIAKAFARIAERESGREGAVLTVAREKDERHAHAEAKKVLAEMGVEIQDLKTEVDDTLIGGWRLEGRGTLIDASYKKHLLDIFSSVTGA
jgi:F0F1-type ATP synthase delta subunit